MTYDFHSCVEFDQVWHFARVLTRIVHVYGHVRDLGSIPIKHLSLAQMVQELELDQVWHFMQVWCVSFTCTATWETWDPTHLIRHHQIPPVRLFSTHLSSSNGSRVRAWQVLHFTSIWHVSFTCTAMWETWDLSQSIRHHQIPPFWLFTRFSRSNNSRVRDWPSLMLYLWTTHVVHMYNHVRDLGPILIYQAPSNTPILTIYTPI